MPQNKTLWKFPLECFGGAQSFSVPAAGVIRFFGMQGTTPCLWIEVHQDAPSEIRSFIIHGTGHPIPIAEAYLGTCFDGPLVWHVYEVYDSAAEEAGDRDPAPAAGREDDAGDGSTRVAVTHHADGGRTAAAGDDGEMVGVGDLIEAGVLKPTDQHGVTAGGPKPGALDSYGVVEESWCDLDALVSEHTIPEIAEIILDQREFAAMYAAMWFDHIGRGSIHALARAAVAKSARRALKRRSEGPEPPESALSGERPQETPPPTDQEPLPLAGFLKLISTEGFLDPHYRDQARRLLRDLGPTAREVLRRALRESDTRNICSASDETDLQKAEVRGAGFVIRILNRLLAEVEDRIVNVRFEGGMTSFILSDLMRFENLTGTLVAKLAGRRGETPVGWALASREEETR